MLVLRALQEQSVFHWDFMTKMRTTFIGHSREEMEKKKAFVSCQHRLSSCGVLVVVGSHLNHILTELVQVFTH